MALNTNSGVVFRCSDKNLEHGFDRVKRQALHWVYEGYPVGDYYEAALPSRAAFCMRDVSHQCTGGEVLGLSSHNKNMFKKFAQGISETRDWCSFWEIDRWNRPCPVDYTNDDDFWYNLPANFDVLHACYRMYLWTGDTDYLLDDDFDEFYNRTMEEYIHTWDRNGDGIPDRDPANGRRGIAGYAEGKGAVDNIQTASDTVAAQTRAYYSYSAMCTLIGRDEQAAIYLKRGIALEKRLHTEFVLGNEYAIGIGHDGALLPDEDKSSIGSLLYWDIIDNSKKTHVLDAYATNTNEYIIEHLCHLPEILWRYGRADQAMAALRLLVSPDLHRKEYPEASFCTIGAIATGLMGIKPNASKNSLETLPQLVDISWAELAEVPVLGRIITLRHESIHESTLIINEGDAFTWVPCFIGRGKIFANGKELDVVVEKCSYSDIELTKAAVLVEPQKTITATFQPQ